ncbi:polysaccharide deacetylase family protein, partial [Microvirga sp. 3-52]|nr:polysaccharide deacetylase family protein [Microvirga sp. 3-52]
VTLLINVAWGNEFIPQILKTLDEHKVKATFFFDGSWVKKNPDLAKQIFNENHEIGNHAYSHPDLKHKSPKETENELKKTNDVIEETLGVKPIWFAPPSGSFKQETITVARNLGMMTILWTADTVDWRNPSTAEMVKRVTSQVENGTMILMHPTRPTAEGLDSMIRDIQ